MVSSSIARCHSTIAGTSLLSYIRSFSEDYYFWLWCNPHILSWSGYRYLLPLSSIGFQYAGLSCYVIVVLDYALEFELVGLSIDLIYHFLFLLLRQPPLLPEPTGTLSSYFLAYFPQAKYLFRHYCVDAERYLKALKHRDLFYNYCHFQLH